MTNRHLYTIGYSPFDISGFIKILRDYNIEALVDVRSQPYSKFHPDFNKQNLQDILKKNGIKYVFLGKELGARRDEPTCYINGKVIYRLVREEQRFKEGIKRLLSGIEKMTVILMCAEKDPITCHRMILICQYLKNYEIDIKHILDNGNFELQADAEKRLLKLWKLDELDLFSSQNENLRQAYEKQGEKIAFVGADSMITPD